MHNRLDNKLSDQLTMNAVQLKVGDMSEVVQVTSTSQDIDIRSTLVAHNVREEEIDRLPKGRSFQSVAMTAPSA